MIKFGTGGWRGIMGKEFTFNALRLIVQAFANILKRNYKGEKVTIALDYDSRFFSNHYAYEAARLFTRNDIEVFFPSRDTPIPALSYKIVKNNLKGGMIITASNNPPLYNGVKLLSENGASLDENSLREIEVEIERIKENFSFVHKYPKESLIQHKDFEEAYLNYLNGEINLELIKTHTPKIVVDPLYGSSREYIDKFFINNDIFVETIHNFRDPYFGGSLPIINSNNLRELAVKVRETKSDVGIAIDLDGDRFGILDEKGRYIHPNIVIPLILDYLIKQRNVRGKIAKSIASSTLIDRIARKQGLEVIETPVGAKYISHLIVSGKVSFGVEQSAGFWFKPHLNEKDGIFGGLIITEILAFYKKPLSALIKELFKEYGKRASVERNYPMSKRNLDKYERFCHINKESIADRKVVMIKREDGIKFIFEDGSWALVRKSGNEPVIRFYTEAESKREALYLMRSITKEFYNE